MPEGNIFDDICKQLRSHSYKLTPQRQTILRVFLLYSDDHLSAEDVFLSVKNIYPEIGMATVYRTLDIFAELEILNKSDFGDGKIRYEFKRNDGHHHHHLICVQCGNVSDFVFMATLSNQSFILFYCRVSITKAVIQIGPN